MDAERRAANAASERDGALPPASTSGPSYNFAAQTHAQPSRAYGVAESVVPVPRAEGGIASDEELARRLQAQFNAEEGASDRSSAAEQSNTVLEMERQAAALAAARGGQAVRSAHASAASAYPGAATASGYPGAGFGGTLATAGDTEDEDARLARELQAQFEAEDAAAATDQSQQAAAASGQGKKTIKCSGCPSMLEYEDGAQALQCPMCEAVTDLENPTQSSVEFECPTCKATLCAPAGTKSVVCGACSTRLALG